MSSRRGVSSSYVPIVVIGSIVVVASIVLAVVLGITLSPSSPSAIQKTATLGFPSNTSQFQIPACGCKLDWPFGTDERIRSNAIFNQTQSILDPRGLSALVPFWGQFIDHDMVLSETDSESDTFEIAMTPYNTTLRLKRNKVRISSTTGCREPVNLNTPFIDGTTVYGDALNPTLSVDSLRDGNGTACMMKMAAGQLMVSGNGTFFAGDPRASEHAILSSLHTLWVREHNRLCSELPLEWTEEERFWKARQIVVAKIQRITYEEWLPAWFGSQRNLLGFRAQRFMLPGPEIATEVSVVSFRVGHSMIPDPVGPFHLPDLFFNTSWLETLGVEPFFQAAYQTQAQRVDDKTIDGLRNFLFSAGPGIIGEDLVTRNLFRAREVGINTYPEVTRCYGTTPRSDTDEQELLVGLHQEPLVAGSSLPRSLARIISDQFNRLMFYDPNFYTRIINTQMGNKYRAEVLSTTLAEVIRLNTALTNVPNEVFYV